MTPTALYRVMGTLFLAAFGLYGGGAALVSAGNVTLGVTLMVCNSVAVILIGLIAYQILVDRNPRIAATYVAGRLIEGVLLALGAYTLTGASSPILDNTLAYQVAMIVLGIVSLGFVWVLLTARMLPRWFAIWGLVGYLALIVGMALDIYGAPDTAMMFLVPGGLFEGAFGLWLIIRGLADVTPDRSIRA